LQDEAENLRGAAEWAERGYVFAKTAGRIRNWFAPFSQNKKKRNSFGTLLRGCAVGFRIWKSFREGQATSSKGKAFLR
jgi:hypothetical protein